MKKKEHAKSKDYTMGDCTYHVTRIFGDRTVKDLVAESVSEKVKKDLVAKAIENECTIFGIETVGGEKFIHYYGYGYYVGDSKLNPYRFLEYYFFYVPFKEAVEKGIKECEKELSELKQGIGSYSLKGLTEIYARYDNGKQPKAIREEDVNAKTENGVYILFPNDTTI